MANVPNSSLKTWNDGDVLHATDYSQDRSILQTAINDNYAKLILKYDKTDVDNLLNAMRGTGWTTQTIKDNWDLIQAIQTDITNLQSQTTKLSSDGTNYTGAWYNMQPSQIATSTVNWYEKQWTATQGQTVFQLTGSDKLYTPNSETTWVMVGGVAQTVGQGYTETDNKTITLAEGVDSGTVVEMRYFLNNAAAETPITNMVGYQENVANPINTNTAQLADIVHNIEDYPIQVPETDDTARIKRALADLVSFGGGVLLIPKMYQISDAIEITSSNIHLLGNGHQTGFKQNASGKISVYVHTSGIKNIKLENFCVDANMFGQEDTGAVTINDVINFVADNVEVKNTPIRVNGISVSQVNTYGVIRGCHVHDCGKGGIYAATSTAFMVIENNNVHDITNVGQTDKEGGSSFDVPGIQVIGGNNIKVVNNRTYNCTSSGIYMMTGGYYQTLQDTPLNNLIHGNTSYGNKQGIYFANAYTTDISAEETRAIIDSNHCFNNTDSGIKIENRNLITIDNNHCFDNANGSNGLGISIKNTQHVSMNGNHCFDNPYSGIQLDGVTHITMTNNQAYVYNGTQTRGLTFAGSVSDTVNMGFNDFNNILAFTTPTNVKAMYNNPDTLDLMLASTKSANPTTLKNGQIWYDSSTNTLKVVINGAVKTFTVA